VGPRAGLDDVEKREFLTPPELELQPLGRRAHSQSLYRLRYPFYTPVMSKKLFPHPLSVSKMKLQKHDDAMFWFNDKFIITTA
jgi:hypothetical protein